MADEILEKLIVAIEGDYSKLLADVQKGVAEAQKRLEKLEDGPKKGKTAVDQMADAIQGKLMAAGAAFIALFSVQKVADFFIGLGKAAIAAGAQFETFTVQFETLLGSASEAKKRIDELAQFGLATAFELPDIVEADRLLQTFGGTTLATGENLRRIGDSAAAVNAPFKEVAFWTGRMYAAIQAGRPFGEASARLQELGIMTGQTRTKLEDLQKAGADGTEIWKVYSDMLDSRFTGAMDRLSKTFQGVMSNIADFQGMLLRVGGEQFFEGVREDAIEFFDIINQPETKEALIELAKGFGSIADVIREAVTSPLLDMLSGLDIEELNQLADSLTDMSIALGKLASSDNKTNINDTVTALVALTDTMTVLIGYLNTVKDALVFTGTALGNVKDVVIGILFPLANIATGFNTLNNVLDVFLGKDISDFTRDFVNATDGFSNLETTGSHALNALQSNLEDMKNKAGEIPPVIDDVAESFDKLDALSNEMIDAQDATAEKREKLESDHAGKMEKIDKDFAGKTLEIEKTRTDDLVQLAADGIEKRAQIEKDTQKALRKLEEDTTEKRAAIIQDSEDKLAKLEKDTANKIADERESHQEEEKRQTEDHQRDMIRLRADYLDNLEDAVTRRDARAVVDLRRKFQRDSSERKDDFETQRNRQREDFQQSQNEIRSNAEMQRAEIRAEQERQLQELSSNEAKRREEILTNQQEQLTDLMDNEAKKREEIQKSYDDQMAKAAAAHAEQLAAEQASYAERKTALDEAAAKRLEDIAKGLADDKDMTEEGARAILEALNKVFGAGGDIDALMEEFAARRRTRISVQIAVENVGESQSRRSRNTPTHPGAGSGGAQGRHPGDIPGFQHGGIVPGQPGQAIMAMVHAGETILPANMNMGKPMKVEIEMSGSAPPGIRSGERDQIAATLVAALREAGIDAR